MRGFDFEIENGEKTVGDDNGRRFPMPEDAMSDVFQQAGRRSPVIGLAQSDGPRHNSNK